LGDFAVANDINVSLVKDGSDKWNLAKIDFKLTFGGCDDEWSEVPQ